jgi:hypothetical protein
MTDNEALADALYHCLSRSVTLANAYGQAQTADEQMAVLTSIKANAVELIATIDALTGDEPPIITDEPATWNID